jgi:hypothetical protein
MSRSPWGSAIAEAAIMKVEERIQWVIAFRPSFSESISNRGLCGLLLNFQLLFVLHSRIPANEGLPELVIEHLRSDLQ